MSESELPLPRVPVAPAVASASTTHSAALRVHITAQNAARRVVIFSTGPLSAAETLSLPKLGDSSPASPQLHLQPEGANYELGGPLVESQPTAFCAVMEEPF